MPEIILVPQDQTVIPFPIPVATPDKLSAALLNVDLMLGPIVAELHMAPGARIPQHRHFRTEEQFYVLEGVFINNGLEYGPGTVFSVKNGESHGPHETNTGCRLLFIQNKAVDPSDFHPVL